MSRVRMPMQSLFGGSRVNMYASLLRVFWTACSQGGMSQTPVRTFRLQGHLGAPQFGAYSAQHFKGLKYAVPYTEFREFD